MVACSNGAGGGLINEIPVFRSGRSITDCRLTAPSGVRFRIGTPADRSPEDEFARFSSVLFLREEFFSAAPVAKAVVLCCCFFTGFGAKIAGFTLGPLLEGAALLGFGAIRGRHLALVTVVPRRLAPEVAT